MAELLEVDVGALVSDPAAQAAVHRIVFAAAGGAADQETPAELYTILYHILFAGAVLIDSVPTMQTKRDIRLAADDARDTMKTMLTALADIKEREGVPMLQLIGLSDAPPATAS